MNFDLDKYFHYIKRTGEFSEHGSSIEEFIDQFDDPWWNTDLSYEDIINDETFWNGFRHWLDLRYEYAMRQLKEDLQSKKIYRALRVKKGTEFHAGDRLGIYWSVYKTTGAHHGNPEGFEIIFAAMLPMDGINMTQTIISRMDYMNGDVEGEINLKQGTTILVTDYKSDDVKAELGVYLA